MTKCFTKTKILKKNLFKFEKSQKKKHTFAASKEKQTIARSAHDSGA